MNISINNRMSGFRKWSQLHQPEVDNAFIEAREGDGIATAAADRGGMTPAELSHRPWLVPGVGKL